MVYEALCKLDFWLDMPAWSEVRRAELQHLSAEVFTIDEPAAH